MDAINRSRPCPPPIRLDSVTDVVIQPDDILPRLKQRIHEGTVHQGVCLSFLSRDIDEFQGLSFHRLANSPGGGVEGADRRVRQAVDEIYFQAVCIQTFWIKREQVVNTRT